MKSPFKLRHWIAVIAFMFLSVATGLAYWARFESYSVCVECALKKESVAWEIPFVHKKMFETSQVVSNRLSEVIRIHDLSSQHEHNWQFVFGSGNGSSMVFGTTRSIASAMTSASTGDFLDVMMVHAGKGESLEWLDSFRNEDRAEWCRCIAESMNGVTFSSSDDFRQWLSKTEEANRHFFRSLDR